MGVGALGIMAVFFCFYPLVPVLKITALKTGRVLLSVKMHEGEEFVLSFIHSVNRRPVYDSIRVDGDRLLIVKSRFDSFGAGMPETSQDGGKLQFDRDGWMEWIVNRRVPEVTFFVGWVANHSLHLKGKEICFTDLAEPGTLVALHMEKASRVDLWKGRYFN